MQKNQGFSLLEMLLILAIVAILLWLGVPNFNSAIRSARLTSSINELAGSLQFARSYAVKKRQSVTVISTGSNNDWSGGWVVFADKNGNGDIDNDDEKMRIFAKLAAGYSLRFNARAITYSSFGISGNSGTFILCDNRANNNIQESVPKSGTAKALIVNIGRARIALDSNNNGIPERTRNTDITSCIP